MSTPIKITCSQCKEEHVYEMDIDPGQYIDWQRGALIQQAMPELKPWERDVFVLGWCKECQDSFYEIIGRDDEET